MNSTHKIFEKMPLTVSICSGKGGVGKSILTANIAFKLSEKQLKTLIWDADSYFPNQHILFGIEPAIRLNQVYSEQVMIIDAISQVKYNLDILADSPALGKFSKNSATPLIDVYKDLLMDTNYDLILFDTPAGATEQLLQCAKISDVIAIVITDEPTSLIDAYGLIKILLKFVNKEKIHLVVNNVIDYDDADEVSYKLNSATKKFLGFEINQLGFIPYDRIVRKSIQNQEIFINTYKNIEITDAIDKLSDNLIKLMLSRN